MQFRLEQPDDQDAIYHLTQAAFAHHPFGTHNEHRIVNALRNAGALTLSLIAVDETGLVGHVAFSPVAISDGTRGWYGLGPVSVAPNRQRQGIGTALIHDGLARLRDTGAAGCVLLGDPAFYTRFGFAAQPRTLRGEVSGLILPGVPPEYFLALSWTDNFPRGSVAFHDAFAATA